MVTNNCFNDNQSNIAIAYIYSTVNQFCERHPAFTKGGVRHNIFHESTNGLKESGAIIRNGRKILINESKWFAWLEAQNGVKA
jgi:hypothetical protein